MRYETAIRQYPCWSKTLNQAERDRGHRPWRLSRSDRQRISPKEVTVWSRVRADEEPHVTCTYMLREGRVVIRYPDGREEPAQEIALNRYTLTQVDPAEDPEQYMIALESRGFNGYVDFVASY